MCSKTLGETAAEVQNDFPVLHVDCRSEAVQMAISREIKRDRKMLPGFVRWEATGDLSKSNFGKVGADCSDLRSERGVEKEGYILRARWFHFIQGPFLIHNLRARHSSTVPPEHQPGPQFCFVFYIIYCFFP